MEQIERIKKMEARLERAEGAIAGLNRAMELYEDSMEDIAALADYLTSDEWMEDFEADEAGALPEDLKRGALAEDGIFDMLEENRQTQVRLAELLAEILRRGRR